MACYEGAVPLGSAVTGCHRLPMGAVGSCRSGREPLPELQVSEVSACRALGHWAETETVPVDPCSSLMRGLALVTSPHSAQLYALR